MWNTVIKTKPQVPIHHIHYKPVPIPTISPTYPPAYYPGAPTYKRDVVTISDDEEHPEGQFEEQVGNIKACIALYVECVPHSSNMPYAVNPISKPSHRVIKEPELPILPLKPIFQPDKIPSIIAAFNNTIYKPIKQPTMEESVHWPWSASIYVEGKLVCVGVLLDRYWVITESSCLSLVR